MNASSCMYIIGCSFFEFVGMIIGIYHIIGVFDF